MVDLSGIGKNVDAANIAAAIGNVDRVKKEEKKAQVSGSRGLSLNDIPATPTPDYIEDINEAGEIDEAAETILDKIDQELGNLQLNIKNVLAQKIKLADKHRDDGDKQHRLLVSAYEDCKNAYAKVREVREDLA